MKVSPKASAMPGLEPASKHWDTTGVSHVSERLDSQDGLGQLCICCVQLRGLMTNVVEGAFQFHATNGAFAGDEAGGVVTGSEDDLVV